MESWFNVLVEGVLLGCLYTLFALGLSLSFGIMRIVNIAHGDLAIAGAFVAIAAGSAFGLSPWACAVIALVVAFGAGYGLQRTILNRTLGADILPPLLVTFGLSIMLQNGMLGLFSADPRSLDVGRLATDSVSLGGDLSVGWLPLCVAGVTLALLFGLQWLFGATPTGRVLRATSDDPEVARLMGLDPRRVYALAMGISAVIATLAGIFLAMRANVSPADGPIRLVYAFEAVIIGGLGSLWGTLAGGVVLGVAQSIGLKFDPGWGILAGHLTFLVLLAVRPQGLFPRTRDR